MKKKCLKVRNDGVELVLHLRYADGLGVLLSFRAPLLACGRLVAALKKRLAARIAFAVRVRHFTAKVEAVIPGSERGEAGVCRGKGIKQSRL